MKRANAFSKFIFLALMISGIFSTQSLAATECDTCIPCHGYLEDVHSNFSHSASLGSGPTKFFPDGSHDSAAREFYANVACATCHTNDLPAVHGNDCATCHPTPYDTLGLWNKGCQQGGCHSFYHRDSVDAHLPYESTRDPVTDCNTCHDRYTWAVTAEKCLNCHATYGAADTSPPTTETDAIVEYIGPARIDFTVKDNGKIGVGRTFYRLDGGAVTASGKKLFVTDAGSHHLEFWSMDQSGNTESAPNNVYFNIAEDTVPPTTTSDARASYGSQGAYIRFSASDNGTLGVKTIYYRLNDQVKTGSSVYIPKPEQDTTYTMEFWSEDWSGNVEAPNSVTFSVSAGPGILRLVWADSDSANPEYPPQDGDWASWEVREGGAAGPVVASGWSGYYNWDGIEDIPLPVSSTPYYVETEWEFRGYFGDTVYNEVYITEPGKIVRKNF